MTNQSEASAMLREKAVEMLQRYVSDTLDYVYTVRKFCNRNSTWMHQRETELDKMRNIQEKAKQLKLSFGDVLKSTNKGKAIRDYVWKTIKSSENTSTENKLLEKDLGTVLKNTVEGMKKLHDFLEAVEKLAATSLHVFTGGEAVLKLFLGIRLQRVEDSISAARLVCPLLLQFKRDASVFFFHPSLHNVDVFVAELGKYIRTTEKICTRMEKRFTTGFRHNSVKQPLVQVADVLSEDAMKSIICHVNQLSDIRMDPDFRLVYLFQDKPTSGFVDKFSEHQPRMDQFRKNIEACAVQLDMMKMGSDISKVAGTSVGAIGGILAAVGVALAPVTAGLSLGLAAGGAGLAFIKVLNTTVTKVTAITVNTTQQKRASECLQSFLQDVNSIQACLGEVTNQREETFGVNYYDVFKALTTEIYTFVDAVTPVVEEEVVQELEIFSNLLESLPILETFGMDALLIYKDSMNLAKGGKSEISKFLRARAKPLCTDFDTWQRMSESLNKGMLESERGQSILEQSLNLLENMENGV